MEDKMNLPKVSIITPSYNQAKFIEETILSVKNQDYPYIEHIIVDGGSTDGTLNILKRYDKDIIWLSEPDDGQADAMNKGFRMASGEILTWLNSDDCLFSKSVVSRIVDFFAQHSDIDIVYGDYTIVDENSKILLKRKEIDFDFKVLLYAIDYIVPSGFFCRRVIDKIGLFDSTLQLGMDVEFWLRAASQQMTFKLIPTFIFTHRWHSESKTVSNETEQRAEARMLMEKYGKVRNQLPLSDNLYFTMLRIFYRFKWQFVKLLTRKHLDNIIAIKYFKHRQGIS